MLDISIPWSVILMMAPILMPFLSIPGALLAGYGWYRRKKNFYAALVAAVAGAFLAPWMGLLVAALLDWSARVSLVGKVVLGLVALLSIGGLVLGGAMYAGSRNRQRR
ncbi:MAG TPA: hypothetical protein VHP33_00445 [Polyangiaceae bacterium]|nr:hypothetical protein [Polyangiaceae bacterium]